MAGVIKIAGAAILLLLSGCGHYADFTLPAPSESPQDIHYTFTANPTPVLSRGQPGEWDPRDALNPSILKHSGLYYNFYSGYDGRTWRTGLATAPDGIHWQKQGPVLAPDRRTWEGTYIAGNGSELFFNGRFSYWYVVGPKDIPLLGLARSPDARQWTKEPLPVLRTGPRGSWDERGVAD